MIKIMLSPLFEPAQISRISIYVCIHIHTHAYTYSWEPAHRELQLGSQLKTSLADPKHPCCFFSLTLQGILSAHHDSRIPNWRTSLLAGFYKEHTLNGTRVPGPRGPWGVEYYNPIYLIMHLSISLSFSCLFNNLSVYLPIYLSTYLPIYPSIYLSIYI